jgi:RNA polymerase sigma-70 factor (ECF subfamily)
MEITLDRPISSHNNETVLVHQIASGDDEALRTLFAVYGQRLYAYALRLTRDPATAEDVLQESLVAVWQGAARFRGQGRVIAWLLGIVHHKSLNALRRKPALLSGDEETLEAEPDHEPSPDERVLSLEQRRLVRAGLDRLSLEHRTVLELIFYQGLSLNEASQVLGCPLGTVKSRLNHAKASLRGCLAREGMVAEDTG